MRRPSLRLTSLSLSLLAVAACGGSANGCTRTTGEKMTVGVPRPSVEPAAVPSPPSTVASSTPTAPELDFARAIRMHDFARARVLLDALDEEERKRPEIRYARALVAIELDDAAAALSELDGLEGVYPPLREEIEAARLRAAEKTGDLTLLEHFLGSRDSVSSRLTLARAHAQGGDPKKAREHGERALVVASRLRAEERTNQLADVHVFLAELREKEGRQNEALVHHLWLATVTPLRKEARVAEERVEKLGRVLTAGERLARAEAFSERGWVEPTAREVELLGKLPGGNVINPIGLVAFATYYSRSDYSKAAELFARAAAGFGDKTNEYLYYEAKSLARAHRDAEALEKYRALARLGGAYAEHAAFQAARLTFLIGDPKEAVTRYEAYAATYKRARQHERELAQELPIARLAAGQFERAEREIGALLDKEKDGLEHARLLELHGVAAEGAGKTETALERYRRVIDERPLSLPALLAAARIRGLGETPPPAILPGPPGAPASVLPGLVLPDKSHRLARVGLDEAAEKALEREEGALRARYGPRSGEALCELYGRLEGARRRYQIAQTATSWSVLRVAPTPASRWQSDCIYPRPYRETVAAEARLRNVPVPFVYGVMRQESAFRPSVVSSANAIGLMQIIPPTAERIAAELGVPYTDDLLRSPAANVRFGTFYLRKLLDRFAGRYELAAAAYNAGPSAVFRWLDSGKKLPLDVFLARIPYEETRGYVVRVLGNQARYAFLDGGEAALPRLDLELPQNIVADPDAY